MIDAHAVAGRLPTAIESPAFSQAYQLAANAHRDWLSQAHQRPHVEHDRLRRELLAHTATCFRSATWAQAQDLMSAFGVKPVELITLVKAVDTTDPVRRKDFFLPLLKRAVMLLSAHEFMVQTTLDMSFSLAEYLELMAEVNTVPTHEAVYLAAERREKLAIMLALLDRTKYAGMVTGLRQKYDISAEAIHEIASRPYFEALWQNAAAGQGKAA